MGNLQSISVKKICLKTSKRAVLVVYITHLSCNQESLDVHNSNTCRLEAVAWLIMKTHSDNSQTARFQSLI